MERAVIRRGEAARLRLHRGDGGEDANVASWRVNGHVARVVVWTQDEWNRMESRPSDAQYYPCGVWCALRFD